MIKVYITKQTNFPVRTTPIKKKLSGFFTRNGIVSDAEVSIAIVGEKKMAETVKKYLKDGKLHNVLSFTPTEVKERFAYPPGAPLQLGEILVCYPVATKEASQENKLVDDKIYELIEHGALHLLGIHHQE
jgi:rRNA maturation RNase YbeY